MAILSKNIIRIGVTGHRELTQQQSAAIEPLLKRAIENIIFYHENAFGNTSEYIFTSSIAEGADTIFAKIAVKYFECKLRIILPFEKEEYIKDFTTQKLKDEFGFLLQHEKVSEINCLQQLSLNERNKLYFEAGKKVVDENDYMIAVWNEQKAAGSGGTADIAEYCMALKKNILVINPLEKIPEIKGIYLPEFLQSPYNKFIRNATGNLLERLFIAYDKKAIINQSFFKNTWKKCFNTGLLAAFLFCAGFALSKSMFLISLQPVIQLFLSVAGLICIIIIARLISNEKKNSFHENYLSSRYVAERLRLDNIFFTCGFQPYKNESKTAYTPVVNIEPLSPLVVINKFIQLCSYSNVSILEKKNIAGALIEQQSNYHRERIKKLLRYVHTNSKASKRLFIFFIVVLIVNILNSIYKLNKYEFNYSSGSKSVDLFFLGAMFLSFFIPVLIGRLYAQKYSDEWEKLISQSQYMISYFEKITVKINAAEEDKQLYRAMYALNENIFIENLEWEMFMLTKNEMMIYRMRKSEHDRRVEFMNEKLANEILNIQLEIQQQTMQYIGREIHDNVGQKLVLAALYIQQADGEENKALTQKKIDSIALILNEALIDLRSLSKNLIQTDNLNIGLYDIINGECKKINDTGFCKVIFESNVEQIELSQSIKNLVLRILQEFIQNSLKHAECSEIKVCIKKKEIGLMVESFDNGKGFIYNNKSLCGIGLKNVMKRADMIGADLSIISEPGKGTAMHLFIPSDKLNI